MRARLASLDAFRGAAVAAMILVNNPGSWAHLYPPLAHAPWHGCTPTDLVFPFFLFAVGNALALAPPADLARIARRTAWLFGLGLLLNIAPFVHWNALGELVPRDPAQVRIMGVLQRIALCYAAAALLLRAWPAARLPWAIGALLPGYWALAVAFGAPGEAAWSLEGWFGTALDRTLLGEAHLYRGEGVPFDPEGLASTLPAIAQVLIGVLVGQAFTRGRHAAHADGIAAPPPLARLLVWGAVLLVAGLVWSLAMPINKKLWTSSYVLYTSGWACLALAALAWAVDARRAHCFAVDTLLALGSNALFIFVLSGLVPRVLGLIRWRGEAGEFTTPPRWLHDGLIAPALSHVTSDARVASLAYALLTVAAYAWLARAMRRRGIVVKV